MTVETIKYAHMNHINGQTSKEHLEYWYKVCKAKENDTRLSDKSYEIVHDCKMFCMALLETKYGVIINEPLPIYREWKQERPFVYTCEGWQIRNTVKGWKVIKPKRNIYAKDFPSFYTARKFVEKKMEELEV